MHMSGKLYIVSTPIGNLGDFSPRARETLETVDFIAAEDTRVGAKLLAHFGVKKPQISYFEHNRREKGEYIAGRIAAGESCALITDAGTPAVSDPGCDLVALCAERGVEVVSVPGCCAAIAALSVAGMECGRFTFEGFLSVNKKSRREHLDELKAERRTMVFYEAPHKLVATLRDMLAAWGDRPVALCREITKLHEEVRRATLSEALDYYTQNAPRGEFVLVIGGATICNEKPAPDATFLLDEVSRLIENGFGLMQAVRTTAAEHSVSKNTLYRLAAERFGAQ